MALAAAESQSALIRSSRADSLMTIPESRLHPANISRDYRPVAAEASYFSCWMNAGFVASWMQFAFCINCCFRHTRCNYFYLSFEPNLALFWQLSHS
jgi:hypothetical protein